MKNPLFEKKKFSKIKMKDDSFDESSSGIDTQDLEIDSIFIINII